MKNAMQSTFSLRTRSLVALGVATAILCLGLVAAKSPNHVSRYAFVQVGGMSCLADEGTDTLVPGADGQPACDTPARGEATARVSAGHDAVAARQAPPAEF